MPYTYEMALKTLSADEIDSYGKNETLFEKIGECIWSPESFFQNWYKNPLQNG